MNRWKCEDCRDEVVGLGGAVGLRAIGWLFVPGAGGGRLVCARCRCMLQDEHDLDRCEAAQEADRLQAAIEADLRERGAYPSREALDAVVEHEMWRYGLGRDRFRR